jgi:ribosomal subunit interface protein
MEIKISFQNMPHSTVIDQHARTKLSKIEEILKGQARATPFNVEMWLTANKQHPHHEANLHVKTPVFNLDAHDEGPDMYIVIDTVIDRMIGMLKKEKERLIEKTHKAETPKKNFSR